MSSQVKGLKEHARKRNMDTIEKVNKTIDRLKRSKTKSVDFKTVAEEAGVTRTTLYNNEELKQRIMSLRALEKSQDDEVVATRRDEIKQKDEKIKQLYKRISELEKEQQYLVEQLVEMEDLKDENKRLREQLDKVESIESKKES